MEVRRFDFNKDINNWNQFVESASNSTFLFNRSFMDYHKDRFTDHSLMVYDDKDNLLACFPANQSSDAEVWSHQGLTYGGFMFKPETKLPVYKEAYSSILQYYNQLGVKTIRYKAFPRFYNNLQTDEIEYCLFLSNATLYRRDTALAIDREYRIPYSGNIRREAKKADKQGVVISEENDFEGFWNTVLVPNLQARFGVNPVHSTQEMVLLKSAFPDKLKLFTAKTNDGDILAGTVMFEMKNVAHCQYISATDDGRKSGALNLLFTTLLDEHFLDKRFFDFGIANENDGKDVNPGLLAWKERMGGRTYSHDFYSIPTENYTFLK